jgi:hypothetical protein
MQAIIGFAYWAPLLINGDDSGYSHADLEEVADWKVSHGLHGDPVDMQEIGFRHDVYAGLGGDAAVHVFPEPDGQYLAYDSLSGLMWDGLGFAAQEIGSAKPLDLAAVQRLQGVYENVAYGPVESAYEVSASISRRYQHETR